MLVTHVGTVAASAEAVTIVRPLDITRTASWILIEISSDQLDVVQALTWDSTGLLRGQSFSARGEATIRIQAAGNDGFCDSLTGNLPVGNWRIELLFHPNRTADLNYTLTIRLGDGETPWASDHSRAKKEPWSVLTGSKQGMELNTYRWDRCLKEGQRWYRGDFHTHTQLSDGKMTPHHLLEVAAERGLDFFAATEHNLLPTGWPHSDSILVIPGIELSSSAGHFNALGIKRWLDWRYNATDCGCESQAGINRLLKDIAADDGAISSLNHSLLPPWDWRWDETPLNLIDALEIINDPTFPGNEEASEAALLAWNILWNDGYPIRGLGGSDTHLLPGESYTGDGRPSLVGDPTTFVFAECLSAAAILQAASEGRIYVSRGPIIDPQITFKGSPCYFGSDLTEIADGDDGLLEFKIGLSNAPAGGSITLVENGCALSRQETNADGSFSFKLNWQSSDYRWARIEIRDGSNQLLAFSNPLYRGCKKTTLRTWGDLRSKLLNQLNN
jgi:hypothetical protein